MNKVRLDKWLWAARFYKTRSIATEAIKGGKVHIDGQRAKPSKEISTGITIQIRQGSFEKTVVVKILSDRRGPATVAETLYDETAESIKKREQLKESLKAANAIRPANAGRPTKKQRRNIIRFVRKSAAD